MEIVIAKKEDLVPTLFGAHCGEGALTGNVSEEGEDWHISPGCLLAWLAVAGLYYVLRKGGE